MILTWQYYAFASAIFAALTAIFGKLGVQEINSNLAIFFRTIVILFMTTLIITTRNEWVKPESLSLKSLFFLIISGITTGLSWISYYKALKLGPASKVAPVDKLSVVFVVIFAILFLGEQLTWKVALGTVFIGIGAVLMSI